ncbi:MULTISPECIES: ABC transporter ATP-binding protein [Mesorhizobium]|uniref:ABC transporter n=1 Tax=Rhizobium loti TaxID=381 RepID=A0A6M7TY66_RHILI|nr:MULTISPECIES: sn-glycerol-3-phosphate ABC transporter ATP-binding protein UgpC [Mesorhizobium]KRB29114.1 ABC transporter [Mesorhizobium sp. Root172]OBQ70591.1 ABC transporter [Mesorhizobium loti]QKC70071.1 sn-glycerol-3-phosphate ABC transporter ATP-binding protein UgpC [Mesorhizobium loti]QKC92046.1 sn-glycerol-3-phosphate ABC transporter ATP-binding protein UgpC [Mesorhizobium sp. NZP2234]
MASIELRGVEKSFGAAAIIRGINLSIGDGEFVALVGPSGCGKSTLLRIISGLESASRGDILLDGRKVNDDSPRDRNVAMVFQSYALYPHMTVAENMAFNLKLSGKGKAEIATRVEEAARMLDLSDLLHRKPGQLSGGQRQRVAMGRAIVRNPSVFLFDEPLSNLDAKLRVQMRGEIKLLHHRVRTTAVYVTHDQIEAMTLADRIVVLNGGNIEQVGSPLELYNRPANLFVAGFIGSPAMNVVKAELRQTAAGIKAVLGDGSEIALPARAYTSSTNRIVLGIRPESVIVDRQAGDLAGTLKVAEPTGPQTHLVVDAAGTDILAIVKADFASRDGDRLWLSFPAEALHVFDAESGKVI